MPRLQSDFFNGLQTLFQLAWTLPLSRQSDSRMQIPNIFRDSQGGSSHSFRAVLAWAFCTCLLADSDALRAEPGIRLSFGKTPAHVFHRSPGKLTYSRSTAFQPLFRQRRKFTQTVTRLLSTGTGTLMVYRASGDVVHGIPAVITLKGLSAYKFDADFGRVAAATLSLPVRARRGAGGALVDIKIPVKVPKALSVITGEGDTNIKITGSRRIDLSGLNTTVGGQAQTVRARAAEGFTVNFEQESQLNVQGTIGDRITLNLQQDSRGQSDISESLQFRYDGDEDDIIQEIEAGRTSLSLPGTRLVGFSSSNRSGLFGLKGRGRLGGLDVTVVTSHDRGASNRKSYQGQAEEVAHRVRDYEYEENRYFFLDLAHRQSFPDEPARQDLVDIGSVRVFVNDFNDRNDIEQRAGRGIAYAFWSTGPAPEPDAGANGAQSGGVEEGFFHELDRSEFLVDARGYLIMTRQRVLRGHTLAVAYRTSDGRVFGDLNFIQDPSNPDAKIRLKLIHARQQRPEFPSWDLAWRNVYFLGDRDIEPEGFELEILRDVAGQEAVDNQRGTPFLQIFGLDKHTNGASESSPPDNLIDIDGGTNLPGLNLLTGHLVFPDLEPFGERGVGAEALSDDARVPEIYNTTNNTTRAQKGQYFLRIRSKNRSTTFYLGFGLIKDSEEVLLNNRRLTRGRDYLIEYENGEVELVGEAADLAADPSANLVINYGSKGQFGLGGGQKSLVGIRAEHPFRDNVSMVGMSLLYGSESARTQRVRVGEEPARTLIWDLNGRFRFKPQILTDFVNRLPFISTQAPSAFNVDMEVAQSLPNPNVKNVAYIDDFEGAESRKTVSTFKYVWSEGSSPTRNGLPLSEPKGRLTWYNRVDRDRYSIYEIQPGRDDIPVENSIVDDVLSIRFEPRRTNGFPVTSRNPAGGLPENSWAGISTYLFGMDFSRSKFVELWIRGNSGRLHIDLGEISERADLLLDHATFNPPPPGQFRTEDQPLPGFPTGDDVAIPEEDIGLDGLTDAQEDSVFRLIFPGVTVPDDPSDDNFKDVDFDQGDLRFRYPPGVNGTQNNNPEREQRPDSEDLNQNGILDTRNNYLHYSVNLASDRGWNPATGIYDGPSVLVIGSQSDPSDRPWRLLRIPLRGSNAPRSVEGNPDTTFAGVFDFARIWIEHDDTTSLDIYTLAAVGSDWLEDESPEHQRSGDFRVATIGTDNQVYELPPGLERETDPQTGRQLLERSLVLRFEDLYPGESVSASRTFTEGQNYTRYGLMTMFVHGGNPTSTTYEDNFPVGPDSTTGSFSPIELFVRFSPIGEDSLNFYEFRKPVYRGWSPEDNTFKIELDVLSQIKGRLTDLKATGQASDTLRLSLPTVEVLADYDSEADQIRAHLHGGTYTVRGNPALSKIKSFVIGVTNNGAFPLEGENEIWLDELRVDRIRKKNAVSMLLNVQTTLADLGNVSLNLERRSGDFQDLQGRSSGNTTTQVSMNSSFNLNKFLPDRWNTTIPVRFNYLRNGSVPRIRQGSDIVLTDQQKSRESAVRASSRFNVSMRKRRANRDPRWIARLLFDRINASLNFLTNNAVSGAITRRRSNNEQNFNGSFSYDVNWPNQRGVRILSWVPIMGSRFEGVQLFYLPSTLRYNMRFDRKNINRRSFSAVEGDTSDVIAVLNQTFNLNESFVIKLTPFRSLTANYSIAVNRDLRNAFDVTRLQFGRETTRNQEVGFNFTPRLSKWLNINTVYSSRFRERLETGGQRTSIGNERRGLTVGTSGRVGGRLSLNLPGLFRPLARPSKGQTGFSVVRLIGRLGGSLEAVQANVTRNRTFNLFGLRRRPDIRFQLGLADTTTSPRYGSGGVSRVNTRNITDNATFKGGVRLPAGFRGDTHLTFNHVRSFGNANTEEQKLEFPSFSAQWRGLGELPVLRWLFASSNVNFNYKSNRIFRGDGGLEDDVLTSDTRRTDFRPLIRWQARWKNKMHTNFSTNRSRQNDLRYQRNVAADTTVAQPTLEERLIGTTITETSQFTASLRYSLSSKFFSKLQSNLDLTLEYGTNTSLKREIPRNAEATETEQAVVRQSDDRWHASLAGQYQFSSKFTGGTRLRHENRKDKLRDLNNRVWEFRVWGEIRFN